MTDAETRSPAIPMILGIIGGVLLGVGSFLNWATVTVDLDKIAAAIGIDPAQIPADVRAQGTASVTGWDIGQGKWTLVIGVVIVIAAALLTITNLTQVAAFVMIFAGAVGGSMVIYQATVGKTQRVNEVAGIFGAVSLPGAAGQYFPVSIDIGIWLCAFGGLFAIVAGVMVMAGRTPPVASSAGAPSGFVPPPSPGPTVDLGPTGVGGSLMPPVEAPPTDEAPLAVEAAPATPEPPERGSGTGVAADEGPTGSS